MPLCSVESCNVLKLQDRMFSTDVSAISWVAPEVLQPGIMTNAFYSSVYHYGCSLMCSGVSVCLLSVLLLQRSCLLSLVAMVDAFMELTFGWEMLVCRSWSLIVPS